MHFNRTINSSCTATRRCTFLLICAVNFRFYMHHITNSMKCINQSLYDTNPNKDISFTISKYQLSSVSPHVQLLKVPREILSSVDHYYISFYPSFQLPIYWRRLICAGNTIIPTEEKISKRKLNRIRQTTLKY